MRLLLISGLLMFSLSSCKSNTIKNSETKSPAPLEKMTPEAPTKVEAATPSKSAETTSTDKAECTHGTDVRLLEVRHKDQGCELAYTKNGQEAVVSTARSGSQHCQTSLGKIKDKLAAAGFTCK